MKVHDVGVLTMADDAAAVLDRMRTVDAERRGRRARIALAALAHRCDCGGVARGWHKPDCADMRYLTATWALSWRAIESLRLEPRHGCLSIDHLASIVEICAEAAGVSMEEGHARALAEIRVEVAVENGRLVMLADGEHFAAPNAGLPGDLLMTPEGRLAAWPRSEGATS